MLIWVGWNSSILCYFCYSQICHWCFIEWSFSRMILYVVSVGDWSLLWCIQANWFIWGSLIEAPHDPDIRVTLFKIDGRQQERLKNHVGGLCDLKHNCAQQMSEYKAPYLQTKLTKGKVVCTAASSDLTVLESQVKFVSVLGDMFIHREHSYKTSALSASCWMDFRRLQRLFLKCGINSCQGQRSALILFSGGSWVGWWSVSAGLCRKLHWDWDRYNPV